MTSNHQNKTQINRNKPPPCIKKSIRMIWRLAQQNGDPDSRLKQTLWLFLWKLCKAWLSTETPRYGGPRRGDFLLLLALFVYKTVAHASASPYSSPSTTYAPGVNVNVAESVSVHLFLSMSHWHLLTKHGL